MPSSDQSATYDGSQDGAVAIQVASRAEVGPSRNVSSGQRPHQKRRWILADGFLHERPRIAQAARGFAAAAVFARGPSCAVRPPDRGNDRLVLPSHDRHSRSADRGGQVRREILKRTAMCRCSCLPPCKMWPTAATTSDHWADDCGQLFHALRRDAIDDAAPPADFHPPRREIAAGFELVQAADRCSLRRTRACRRFRPRSLAPVRSRTSAGGRAAPAR